MDRSAAVSVPRIATSRLLLREYRLSDFDAYAEHLADASAQQHLSGVVDRRTAWRLFMVGPGSWMLCGAGWWAVELTETREVVGTVGAFYREKAIELELGWNIYRKHWGRGFATEAAKAALEHGFTALDAPHAIALIDAPNAASIRVSRKLGMQYEGDVEHFGSPVGRYVVKRRAG
jgi:RimJ/RimL family protein N-acetyltransferase